MPNPAWAALEGWRYWRCFRCRSEDSPKGTDFELSRPGETPKCPKCGATGPALLAELIPTHLLFEDTSGAIEGEGASRFRIACQPTLKRTIAWHHHATGEPRAVTCKRCQDTKEFQAMAAAEANWTEQSSMKLQTTGAKDGCGCAEVVKTAPGPAAASPQTTTIPPAGVVSTAAVPATTTAAPPAVSTAATKP